jgi:hypothetical protein
MLNNAEMVGTHELTERLHGSGRLINHAVIHPNIPGELERMGRWLRMSLADMIFRGVLERYPKLQVGTVEHELPWIAHFLGRIDYTYTQRVQHERYRFKEDMLPSDYCHRNVFARFQEDALGIRDRHIIGVDNLLWG